MSRLGLQASVMSRLGLQACLERLSAFQACLERLSAKGDTFRSSRTGKMPAQARMYEIQA